MPGPKEEFLKGKPVTCPFIGKTACTVLLTSTTILLQLKYSICMHIRLFTSDYMEIINPLQISFIQLMLQIN